KAGFRSALLVAHQGPANRHDHFASILGRLAKFANPFAVLGQFLFGLLQLWHAIPIVELLYRLSQRFLRSPTVKTLGALVPLENPVPHVDDEDSVVGAIQ